MHPGGRLGGWRVYDDVLRVSRFYHWTDTYVLAMPVQRFWICLEQISEHERRLADAARQNPFAALALFMG
jgi:hypothetical protein